ncbi:metallophosphoesterase [Spongiivirga sp. MCCC 1A20706]|uniref:metallophosphoesterase n=1 Tax=Spongiivirga sp. MCCC 1A20706 TaxID=3160963 RepID=UPI003977640D
MGKRGLYYLVITLFLGACATFKPQYLDEEKKVSFPKGKTITHSFYLLGDAGLSEMNKTAPAITAFKVALGQASKNSTAIFLGDNIYPDGLPDKAHPDRKIAEHQLDVQTDAVANFKGKTMFIPGNHDWYSDGLDGLSRQQKYIEKKLNSKKVFFPEDGCPLKQVKVNDDIVVIAIDTQWYLANWDNHPTINDNCEIKTRTKFFDELEGLIKKNRGRTTILAAHHPMFTNGPHGGQYSIKQQFYPTGKGIPLPILGSIANLIRKTGGISPQDLQHKRYRELRKRIITLAQESEKVIIVSGHEHSLQYIVNDNTVQIVSGSGSKESATRTVDGGQFSYGKNGFARLDIFKDGSSFVRFYGVDENDTKEVFSTEVLKPKNTQIYTDFKEEIPTSVSASIYTEEEVTKGRFFKGMWGERYRKYYGTKVNAPTVLLDTLFGGLTPIRKGGGHQSKSLRLEDKDGREYVMRALRKSALQYLQAVAFKDQYIQGQFENTYTEKLLLDVFTGSHPYAPFVIGKLADEVEVFHTNPTLYFVPKQAALNEYNNEFGDELYMIEERAASGHGDKSSFGNSDELISTDELFENLRKDEKYKIDEESYIRARLFDMVIGDWDRHEDQWRWAEFKEDNHIVYRPVPRDRDQAFSIMSDGFLLGLGVKIIPTIRLLTSYDEKLKSTKWFNVEPYPLDMALIDSSDKSVWDAQVQAIKNGLTDEVIHDAFRQMPEEVQDQTITEIKLKLKGRLRNLQKISDEYYKHMNRFTVVKGTDKDDWFDIEALQNGNIKVTAFRIKKGKKATKFHERIYKKADTKEIWIYGLDDDDHFEVLKGWKSKIKVRLIGGQNKDTYVLNGDGRTHVYDFISKKSEIIGNKANIHLTNDYETNVYDYKKLKNNINQLIPVIGFNPDDGFKIGVNNKFIYNGFARNPFTQQHTLRANYFFATSGFSLAYEGEFAKVFGKWNFMIEGLFTSSNYAINFFGFGNETENNDDELGLNFNRVRLSTSRFAPSLVWRGELGAKFQVGVSYENVEVEQTEDRFINQFLNTTGEISKNFFGTDAKYTFNNADNIAFPTLGMGAELHGGFKVNADDTRRAFAYLIPSLSFDHKLVPSGAVVLATKIKSHLTFGDDFEFYQAASIGANDGPRGYRNQRFTGKSSFYQNTDLRINIKKIKSGLVPLNLGLYAGFDYGKVWIPGEVRTPFNTAAGGGIFINAVNMLTANVSFFGSDDGGRFAFRFGFGF